MNLSDKEIAKLAVELEEMMRIISDLRERVAAMNSRIFKVYAEVATKLDTEWVSKVSQNPFSYQLPGTEDFRKDQI